MTQSIFRPTMLLLLIAGASSSFSSNAQSLYKSVGADGKVHYSDRPNGEGRAEKTMEVESLPSNQVPGLTHSYVEQLRELKEWQADYARRNPGPQASTRSGTVLYAASWCGYCKLARAYMVQHGIKFQEVDVDSKSGRDEFKQLRTPGGGIPLLVASGKKLSGFTRSGYDGFFFENLKLPAQ